jgi:hypothetical protein
VIVIIDEGVAVEGAIASKTRKKSNEFLQFLFSLRHMHIALVLADPGSQRAQLSAHVTGDEIDVHHTRHQYAINAIRAAGASEDELDAIQSDHGSPYDYVTIPVSAKKRHHTDEPTPEEKKELDDAAIR